MKLQKFENVDVIASLEAIMKQNTAFYQSDFDIDKQILRKAAVSLIPEDKRLLWFSRPSGTCCFRERDVFLKDTRQHNTWRFYGEQTRDTILAYAVELTGTEQEKIKGNLYELDYLQHFREVIEKSIPADNYTLIYEHGELTKPAGQYFDGDTDPQLGKFIRFEAQPNDPEALKSLLREQQKKRTPHTQRDFQLHIAALHDRQIETEARRIVENVKGLGEPDSPEKTHCAVELSPYFVPLATDKDMERLLSMLPYKSLSLSTLEGRHGVYALIDKSERKKEMKQGFVKVAAASCAVVVADVRENTRVILETIHKMEGEGAKVMVLPELALTGYTCSDLFWQSQMIDAAKEGLKEIADGTKETDALIFVGLPWEQGGKLFNVAAVLCHGELLGVVPKKYLPNYNEFYELRHFTPGKEAVTTTEFFGKEVPFGMNLLFQCEKMPRLKVAAELCEDLWTPNPPSVAHALAGATVVVNLSASDEMVGKDSYRRSLVSAQSARLICGYIYATAGEGESTTDLVFGGQHLIAENGTILAEAKRFENQIICADLDVDRLTSERRRMTTYPEQRTDGYQVVRFSLAIEETKLTRYFDPRPFVPSDKHNRDQR